MKILRVRLKNYRGTDDRDVAFAPTGVTLVAGPNEIGKSSLAEAIDVIFDHLDSTAKQEIKAIKPVHRDAGAEIEIDVRTGPYEFTYFKRFHKDKATRLHVSHPRAEDWTGREAHDRARAILEETVDLNLWKALRIEQGEGIGQAALADQTALSRALDRAAGGTSSGAREESLYEAVRNEFLHYFTETGREKKELSEAAAAVEIARADTAALSADLKRLEADIARSERLAREIRDLENDQAQRVVRWEVLEKERQAVDRLKNELANLKERCDAVRAKIEAASTAVGEREGILAELTEAESSLRKIAEDIDATAPARGEAIRDLEAAEKTLEESRERHRAAQRALRARQEDYQFRHEALDLEQIEERKARIDHAIREALEAEETLAAIRVDDPLYEEIQAASLELYMAQARVEREGPSVRIEAQADISPEMDGMLVHLPRGKQVERPVGDSLTIRLAGIADITVKSGTSAEAARKALVNAAETLADLCARAGVAGLKEAGTALETRKEALRRIDRRDEVLGRDLRDLTLETLDAKLLRLRERVSAYPETRSSDLPLPQDFDTAKAWITEATSAAAETEAALERATRESDFARVLRDRLDRRHTENSVLLDREKERIERTRQKLASARARETDEALRETRNEAERALSRLEAEAGEATKRLAAQNPDRVEALGDNARQALDKVKRQLQDLLMEQSELTGSLRERGEEGLSERLGEAEARAARLERGRDGLRARAAAANLLYDTLTEERETARRNYVAPLRERIEKLGRIVFGETFGVEMGDDLSILSRTLDGRAIPWNDLSGGTKEQIGLFARLACALIVSEDEGVPLIIDDALGNTDPERLEGMAAVLSVAGRECQIIVLTCYPERYRHVATAEIVNIR